MSTEFFAYVTQFMFGALKQSIKTRLCQLEKLTVIEHAFQQDHITQIIVFDDTRGS